MSDIKDAPVVRTPEGAILGMDFRRTNLAAPEFRVPGRVPARVVMPGDTLVAQGSRVVVQAKGEHNGNVVLSCLSAAGAPIVVVRPMEMLTRVVAVGAFDQ